MRFRCQKVYLNRQRCQNWAHGDSEFCRWHKIMLEFRRDYKGWSPWIPQSLMYGAYGGLAIFGGSLWMLSQSPGIIWPLVALIGLGSAFMGFADAIMARDYPLSQFAFWAKLLAIGLGIEVIGGAIAAVVVASMPETSQPMIQLVSNHPNWLTIGPALLVTALAIETAMMLRLFVKRILFKKILFFDATVWLVALGIVGLSFQPVIQKGLSIQPDATQKFWEVVLGEKFGIPMAIAYFVGFNLAEVINVRMRRSRLNDAGFKATYMISFGACTTPPIVAMLISRYLLFWSGMSGAVMFIVLAVGITIPLSILTSRWVVQWGLRQT